MDSREVELEIDDGELEMSEDQVTRKRKYEAGTAYDPDRMYKSFDDTIVERDIIANPSDIWYMTKRDSQVRQLASGIRVPIRTAGHNIVASEGDSGEKEFIEHNLFAPYHMGGMSVPFDTLMGQISTAVVYKRAHFEKVFRLQKDGKYKGSVMLHKMAFRPPNTCKMRSDRNGSFDGFWHWAYKDGNTKEVTYKPDKAFVYIHMNDENPLLGATAFENVYQNWKDKRKVMFFYLAFLENVAFPRTIVTSAEEDPDELQFLVNKAKRLGSHGIVGKYPSEEIEPYESSRNTRDYQNAVEYLDWQMTKATMMHFMELGNNDERGSLSLSQDKSAFFYDGMQAVLDQIAVAFDEFVIAPLIKMNFGTDASVPRLEFKPVHDKQGESIIDLFKQIMVSPTPNVTPPFMLKLMNRVENILDLDIDPTQEYDAETYQMILDTIPTAREEMEQKGARAGAGQNPVSGLDKNSNNDKTAEEDREYAKEHNAQIKEDKKNGG